MKFSLFVCFCIFVSLMCSCASNAHDYPLSDPAPGLITGGEEYLASGSMAASASDRKLQSDQHYEAHQNKNQQHAQENKALIEKLRKKGADVRGTDRGVVINLPDMLFEFDRYALTDSAKITILEISSVLREVTGRSISVEGHTDSIGTVLYNKQLSLKRAQEVAGKLKENGVSGSRMKFRGVGEGYPIASNNTELGRSRNRRVEIVIEN